MPSIERRQPDLPRQSLSASVENALQRSLEAKRFSVGELGGEGGEYWKTNRNTAKRSDLIYWLSRGELATKINENDVASTDGAKDGEVRNPFRGVLDLWQINEQISGYLAKSQQDEVSGRSLFLRRDRDRADGRTSLPELGTDRMMLAAYPVVQADSSEAGSRFTVHCDNPPGEQLTGDNGRVLTFTFYPNQNWDASLLGGQIRIYPCGFSKTTPPSREHWKLWSGKALPQVPASIQESVILNTDSDSYEVSPVANRLCIFFSDERAPHEVLPVKVKSIIPPSEWPLPSYRYAITQWFTFLSPEEQLRGLKEAMRAWIANRASKKATDSSSS